MLSAVWSAIASEAYDPYKGWSTQAQPQPKMDTAAYNAIAKEALPVLRDKAIDFCDKNKLSAIEVTPEALLQYERSDEKFRPWLNKYCEQTGQSPYADVMLVVGAKPLESCDRKATYDPTPPDRIKDYARCMIVRLDNRSCSQSSRLNRFGDLKNSLENDDETIARKNQLWAPTKRGYRGYKALWLIDAPEESELAGFSILAEVKLETESHMDAHKLTRKYMGFQRTTDKKLPEFYNRCSTKDESLTKTTNTNYRRIDNTAKELDTMSRQIYDRLYEREGYNRFLDPQRLAEHAPPAKGRLHAQVSKVVDMLGSKILSDIVKSGVVPSRWAQIDPHLAHDKV